MTIRRWAGPGGWLAVAATALALAGCTSHAVPGGTPSSAPPSAGASAGVGALGGQPSPAPPSPAAASYPSDALAYAKAAINAWLAGDHARLAQLSSPGVVSSFGSVPGQPDRHWHGADCEGAAGSSYCPFFNNNGDRLLIRLSNQSLGAPHAVSEETFQATTYPATADAYVTEFLKAWQESNTYRMRALSTDTVTSYFVHYTPQQAWTLADEGTAGHTHVHITNTDGFDQTVDVTNQDLKAPHAISVICNPTCP
jgi:hypothetical protein